MGQKSVTKKIYFPVLLAALSVCECEFICLCVLLAEETQIIDLSIFQAHAHRIEKKFNIKTYFVYIYTYSFVFQSAQSQIKYPCFYKNIYSNFLLFFFIKIFSDFYFFFIHIFVCLFTYLFSFFFLPTGLSGNLCIHFFIPRKHRYTTLQTFTCTNIEKYIYTPST